MKIFRELKKAYKKLNDQFFRARSNYIKYYEKLPIDPYCILLESQHGENLNGNIYYIAKYLSSEPKFQNYTIYFVARGRKFKQIQKFFNDQNIKNINIIILASEKYFQVLASAKYLINDTSFTPSFIKKEGQVYLNTWHGTPLKTLGKKVNNDFHNLGNIQKNFVCSDFILAPNELVKQSLVEDYMLENLCDSCFIKSGYPRNEVFFDKEKRIRLRESLDLLEKHVYTYMPTYRGTPQNASINKNDIYLTYFLYEIDKYLRDDEVLYVNFHQLVANKINLKNFQKIRPFPTNIETYEFLSISDCLITDYSSVFFDFANTRKKIVLFPYDQEEYLRDRGMYLNLEDLPFPKVYNISSLLEEVRSPVNYDDTTFLKKYCQYESISATEKLCNYFFFQKNTDLDIEEIKKNQKKNIIIYAGNLAGNGITTSLRNLLSNIDLEKRNYYITFKNENVAKNKDNLRNFPEKVNYISILGDMNLTIGERVIRKLFKKKIIPASLYMKLLNKRMIQDWNRCFGTAHFDTAIQFNGYESEVILLWSSFKGNKVIYVHNDMLNEIRTRKNQRKDVLKYAYRIFNKVAVVTQDILDSTVKISKKSDNIYICHNVIDYRSVEEKSQLKFELGSQTILSQPEDSLRKVLEKNTIKFISIGRFSPEKGHLRLLNAFKKLSEYGKDIFLIIVGGNSNGNYYQYTLNKVMELGLQDKVFLIKNLPNPFPLLKKCDYFVLSSYYEGFGLVIAEADILNKPVISTDIVGPRTFIKKYGGTLVENTEDGLFKGMLDLMEHKIKPMHVDYQAYNEQVLKEFELLF